MLWSLLVSEGVFGRNQLFGFSTGTLTLYDMSSWNDSNSATKQFILFFGSGVLQLVRSTLLEL